MMDAYFKIALFGDPEVNMTGLTQRFLTNIFVPHSKMTIGVDFEVKSLELEGKKVKLQIWDFGLEERFRFLLPTYVRSVQGGFFCYNIANYSSIAHVDEWLTGIRKGIKVEDRFPIIMVGIISEVEKEREVPIEEGIKLAKSRSLDGFIECNIRTGENVEEAFKALTRLMLERASY